MTQRCSSWSGGARAARPWSRLSPRPDPRGSRCSGPERARLRSVTAAEVVGLSPDGSQLVLRVDGRSVEVPRELARRAERVAARHLSRAPDPSEPLTPRSIQQRIRCGESAEDIADGSGVPVADVARY